MSYIKQSFIFKLFFFVRVLEKIRVGDDMKYFYDTPNGFYTKEESNAFAEQALDTLIGISRNGFLDLRWAYQRMLDYELCEDDEVGDYLAELVNKHCEEFDTSIAKIDFASLVNDECADKLKEHIENITGYEFDLYTFSNFLDSHIYIDEYDMKKFIEYLENLEEEKIEEISDKINEDTPLNKRMKELIEKYDLDLEQLLREWRIAYKEIQLKNENLKRQR